MQQMLVACGEDKTEKYKLRFDDLILETSFPDFGTLVPLLTEVADEERFASSIVLE